MHNGALRKWALALTFWLALYISSLKAQTSPLLPLSSSSTGSVEVDVNGLLFDTGTFATGSLSLSNTGTRMIWYPGKAAFRAGYVAAHQWDDTNIGNYSLALGNSTMASGSNSMATGYYTTSSGAYSIAMGELNTAMGIGSVALGVSSTAATNGSLALGYGSRALTNNYNTAIGYYTTASGYGAAALGAGTSATGSYSTALGFVNTASGAISSASGYHTVAQAYLSFALGTWNVGGGNSTGWVPTDPLFEIGNGTSSTSTHDAMVVYKNGNATLQGTLNVAPGGDVPMYAGY